MGLSIVIAEFAIGRKTQLSPVGAFEKLAPGSSWKYVGFLGVASAFVILSFYACMYIRMCVRECACMCVYVCVDVCMCACVYVFMYACMHACMSACMHVCMYACMHICMYACIDTQGDMSHGSAPRT